MLHELHTTMKTYQAYQAESRQAETKLRVAEQQRSKLEVAIAPPEKLERSKKYKLIEKEVNKVRKGVRRVSRPEVETGGRRSCFDSSLEPLPDPGGVECTYFATRSIDFRHGVLALKTRYPSLVYPRAE